MTNRPEFKLHTACVAYLHGSSGSGKRKMTFRRPFPDLFNLDGTQRFTHIAQGRSKQEGGMLKMMGLRPGVLDLLLWPRCGLLWIDFKVDTPLSRDQRSFVADMMELGIAAHTASSVRQFSEILIGHGLKREHDLIVEPDLRSWDEKVADAHNYFAP